MKKRDDLIKDKQEAPEGGLSRRRFMGAAALAGVAGATGLGSTIMTRESFAAAAKEAKKTAVGKKNSVSDRRGSKRGMMPGPPKAKSSARPSQYGVRKNSIASKKSAKRRGSEEEE